MGIFYALIEAKPDLMVYGEKAIFGKLVDIIL